MRTECFDLNDVTDVADFYRQFAARFALDTFGANLDALWDVLTGHLNLPLCVKLLHLQQHPQRQALKSILQVMREAQQETEGEFSVLSDDNKQGNGRS